MDNKVTKKRVSEHLEYDWYIYLIIVIATIVVFYFAFSQINATRNYEGIDFFVSCYPSSGDNNFGQHVLEDMANPKIYTEEHKRKYGDNILLEVNIEERDPLGSDYGTLLPTHGYVSSDVLIVGEKIMEDGSRFLQLTDELLTDYLLPEGMGIDDLEYYTVEDKNGVERKYGIKLENFSKLPFEFDWEKDYKEQYEGKDEELQPDKTFYLVISTQSVSIGKFGKHSKNKNAHALFCVNRFIEYYK